MLRRVGWQILTGVFDELNASIMRLIALMTEAVSTSELSVNLYQTEQRNITEDSRLHITTSLYM
jgi:hypothetical protein